MVVVVVVSGFVALLRRIGRVHGFGVNQNGGFGLPGYDEIGHLHGFGVNRNGGIGLPGYEIGHLHGLALAHHRGGENRNDGCEFFWLLRWLWWWWWWLRMGLFGRKRWW